MCFFKKNSNNLPNDVINKIKRDFSNQKDQEKIIKELEKIYDKNWNVGSKQLVRSILFLIDSNTEKIENFLSIPDPRDVLSEANELSNGKYNFFNKEFEEI